MKNVIWFALTSFLLSAFVACSDSGTTAEEKSAEKEHENKAEKEITERDILDSIISNSGTTIRLNHSNGGDGTYISEGFRQSRVIDTTIEINKFIEEMVINIRFNDPSVCNYSNTKFLLNGKEIKGEKSTESNGSLVFKDIFKKQNETYRIEILTDSAKCGNLKETYTLVPSEKPGDAHFTEVCYNPDDAYYIKGHFYARVIPCYYGGFYSTYADSVQSKCFLKTESDTMELKIEFEKDYDIMNARYYQEGSVSLDSVTLVNFLKDDTSATLSCALVFQDWVVPAQVTRELKYYNKNFFFKEASKARLLDVITNEYYLMTVEPYNFVDYLFTRTTVNGEKIFAKEGYGIYDSTSLGILHEIRWKDVYDGLIDESTTEDSVQILAVSWPEGFTRSEETALFQRLREIYAEEDSTIFATTLDSIMNAVTDKAGNIKEQFYFMDAKRVPGYDINDYK